MPTPNPTPPLQGLYGAAAHGGQFLLWNVGSQIVGALLTPMTQAIESALWREDPNVPPSPSLLAGLAAHNLMDDDQAAGLALSSGIDRQVFDMMKQGAMDTPAVSVILEAARRGLLAGQPNESAPYTLEAALEQTGMRREWIDLVAKMTFIPPTQEEALQGLLEGQIPESVARQRYIEAGGDPSWFTNAFNIRGQAPTPVEALELANRGIIPWEGDEGPDGTSYKQAFLEGPWRNKWLPAFKALGEYLPPPRTVTAMHRDGSLTDEQAIDLYRKAGLSQELAAAYLESAKHETVAADRELSRTDVTSLYMDGIISRTDAAAALASLRYTARDVDYILALAEFRKAAAAVRTAVNRVKSLYEAHKITRTAASGVLAQLGVPADQVADMLTTWDLIAGVNVRTLTVAQVVDAWKESLISVEDATAELTAMGYTTYDAWILLSLKIKAPAFPEPPRDPGPGVGF